MYCPHCGLLNGEDDHRCLHCGRLMPGIAIAAPESYIIGAAETLPPPQAPVQQPDLFEEELRQAADRFGPADRVPARVYADGHVAPPMRRLTAAAIDVVMVVLGFGTFAGTARFAGSAFGGGKVLWITLSASLILIALLYGLVWAVARRETAGMYWTQLHVVTFDGSRLSGRNRAIRFISVWLSYCSGGLGALWALADEENLAFHDHISKTYPAEKAGSRILAERGLRAVAVAMGSIDRRREGSGAGIDAIADADFREPASHGRGSSIRVDRSPGQGR
jgi:uncharacterized RDD family membrane protein YckC